MSVHRTVLSAILVAACSAAPLAAQESDRNSGGMLQGIGEALFGRRTNEPEPRPANNQRAGSKNSQRTGGSLTNRATGSPNRATNNTGNNSRAAPRRTATTERDSGTRSSANHRASPRRTSENTTAQENTSAQGGNKSARGNTSAQGKPGRRKPAVVVPAEVEETAEEAETVEVETVAKPEPRNDIGSDARRSSRRTATGNRAATSPRVARSPIPRDEVQEPEELLDEEPTKKSTPKPAATEDEEEPAPIDVPVAGTEEDSSDESESTGTSAPDDGQSNDPATDETPLPIDPPSTVRSSRRRSSASEEKSTSEIVRTEPTPSPAATSTNKAGEIAVSAKSPALKVDTTGPRKLIVNREAPYKVVVQNLGESSAENITVSIDFPEWAEVRSVDPTSGSAEAVDGASAAWRWRLSNLAARGRAQLILNVVPRESRAFELKVQWACAPASSQATIDVQEPKLEIALDGPKVVSYGTKTLYKLSFSNPGTADTENVVVKLLPLVPGVDAADSHTIGKIAAGATRSVEVELVARQAGDLAIRIEATAEGGLSAPAAHPIHVRRAELATTVEGPKFQFAGSVVTYQLAVSNPGDDAAKQVRVVAALPRGAELVNATGGGRFVESKGAVTWDVGTLGPGDTQSYSLKVKLLEDGTNELRIDAEAAGDITHESVAVTSVEAVADLALVVTDPSGPVPVGEEIVYEIRVKNRGAKSAAQVAVVGYFSDGVEAASAQGGKHQIDDGKVVFDVLPALGPGEERVFKIKASASRAGVHTLRAEVRCDSLEDSALAVEETTRFYGDEK